MRITIVSQELSLLAQMHGGVGRFRVDVYVELMVDDFCMYYTRGRCRLGRAPGPDSDARGPCRKRCTVSEVQEKKKTQEASLRKATASLCFGFFKIARSMLL